MVRLICSLVLPMTVWPVDELQLDKPIQGVVKKGASVHHLKKLSPSFVYSVVVESKNFKPYVSWEPGDQVISHPTKEGVLKTERVFSPLEEIDSEVSVEVNKAVEPTGPLEFTLTAKRWKLDLKPILEVKGSLTKKDDDPTNGIHKRHIVKLAKDRIYVVEMTVDSKSAVASPFFERKVAGQKDEAQIIAFGANSGKAARCIIRPKFDGDYSVAARIFATNSCGYSLKVSQQAKE